MKRLLRYLLPALLAVFTAAPASAQFRWGAVAGVDIDTYIFKQHLLKTTWMPGPSAGIQGEMMFSGIGLGIDVGLSYSMHGARLHFGDYPVWASSGYGTQTAWLHSIQVPLNLRFKYTRLGGLEDRFAPFVYGGPVFSLTVGHNKVPALEYSGGAVMLQCGLGVELWKRWQLQAGYVWGVTYEIRTRKLDNYSARTEGVRIRAVYYF